MAWASATVLYIYSLGTIVDRDFLRHPRSRSLCWSTSGERFPFFFMTTFITQSISPSRFTALCRDTSLDFGFTFFIFELLLCRSEGGLEEVWGSEKSSQFIARIWQRTKTNYSQYLVLESIKHWRIQRHQSWEPKMAMLATLKGLVARFLCRKTVSVLPKVIGTVQGPRQWYLQKVALRDFGVACRSVDTSVAESKCPIKPLPTILTLHSQPAETRQGHDSTSLKFIHFKGWTFTRLTGGRD